MGPIVKQGNDASFTGRVWEIGFSLSAPLFLTCARNSDEKWTVTDLNKTKRITFKTLRHDSKIKVKKIFKRLIYY